MRGPGEVSANFGLLLRREAEPRVEDQHAGGRNQGAGGVRSSCDQREQGEDGGNSRSSDKNEFLENDKLQDKDVSGSDGRFDQISPWLAGTVQVFVKLQHTKGLMQY